jgi:hypothetical protein
MIPVMGLPILNKPELMERMLGSVDHDVQRLYIIDNGAVVTPGMVRGFRANDVHIADPGFNLGVGPSWNLIIKANIQAPWWLITSNDMQFQPGCLSRLVDDMDRAAGTPHLARIVIGHDRKWGHHFGAFALNAECVDTVGWFDENIQPIYYEDTDYIARMERAKKYGFTLTDIDSESTHVGEQSWKTDSHNAVGNKRSWDLNRDYFDSKWAATGGVPLSAQFDTPFGDDGYAGYDGLRGWPQPKVERMRQQDWRVERKDNVKNDGHFA